MALPTSTTSPSALERGDRIRYEIACRAEIFVNWVRIGFVGAVVLRSALLSNRAVSLSLDLAVFALTIAASTYFLLRASRRTLTDLDLVGSTSLDVVLTIAGLATNVLQPHADYTGLLHMPDTGAAIAITGMSTLRLSPAATLASALGMMGSLYALAEFDVARNSIVYVHDEHSILFLVLASAGFVAFTLTLRVRRLVRDVASFGGKLARAEAGLELVLREHHHAKGTISAALAAAATLERDLHGRETKAPAETLLAHTAAGLSGDLEALLNQLASVRERAVLELESLNEAKATDVTAISLAAIREISTRHPDVRFDFLPESSDDESPPYALVCGGHSGLHRLLVNLLVNACEGDGRRRARNVAVTVGRTNALGAETLAIGVRDDGPGVDGSWLRGSASASTKPWGSGLGLRLVRGVTEASGGVFLLQNAEGGTLATVLLRATRKSPDVGLSTSGLSSMTASRPPPASFDREPETSFAHQSGRQE